MRRRIVRPFGSSIPASRALSMLVGLAVLWVLFDTMREPAHWNWLEASDEGAAGQPASIDGTAPDQFTEIVVPGPNDLDSDVWADFLSRDELITDKTALRTREMIAYWQLLGWARTQPFAELERRAIQEPALTQIWDEPKRYRGKLLRLRLHVRRVLEFETDPTKNPLGASKVYEVMGWTDESKSLPYTVVLTERPPGLPVGKDVEAEVVFVGYFFKIMTYTAFDDTRRGTPLLMGRLRMAGAATRRAAVAANPWEVGGLVLGGAAVTALLVWFLPRKKRTVRGTVFASPAIDTQWVPLEDTSASAEPGVAVFQSSDLDVASAPVTPEDSTTAQK